MIHFSVRFIPETQKVNNFVGFNLMHLSYCLGMMRPWPLPVLAMCTSIRRIIFLCASSKRLCCSSWSAKIIQFDSNLFASALVVNVENIRHIALLEHCASSSSSVFVSVLPSDSAYAFLRFY